MAQTSSKTLPGDQAPGSEEAPPSVLKILKGTLAAIGMRGTRGLSMSHIGEAAGVSRATLYRYFPDKDAVLAAVSEYISVTFEQGVRDEANKHEDPMERLRAVLRYLAEYTDRAPNQILEVEPRFMIDFLRSHHQRHVAAVLDAMGPCFTYLEDFIGAPIDGPAVAEAMLRLQLSSLILPPDDRWSRLWLSSVDSLLPWIKAVSAAPPARA